MTPVDGDEPGSEAGRELAPELERRRAMARFLQRGGAQQLGDGGREYAESLRVLEGIPPHVGDDSVARVVDLVEGFETAFGLELLATIHWLAVHEGVTEIADLERETHNWNTRKAQFTSAQIRFAADRLEALGWLAVGVAA